MIEIHADGSFNPTLNQGGWGAIVVENGQKHVFSGVVKHVATKPVTNNRMEITAALKGILQTPQGAKAVIFTDSQYLFNCAARGWHRRVNHDLWKQLDEAVSQRQVRWEWISRNTNDPLHQKAHNLAMNSANRREGLKSVLSEEMKNPVVEELTHFDMAGRPRMVDVTEKPDTQREAVARGRVRMKTSTLDLIKRGKLAKGDVLAVAQLAGTMAAKQTPHIIPLCHPILIGDIKIEFNFDNKDSAVEIITTVKSIGKTGVEMEALTATAVAALTIYDMCKAVEHGIIIGDIRLVSKGGGKSGVIFLE